MSGAPYLLATATLVVAMLVLVIGRRHLATVGQHHQLTEIEEAEAITAGDEG